MNIKNKYLILSWFFALYPIILSSVFKEPQMHFIYSQPIPERLTDLIVEVILNSWYVSAVLGFIFGVTHLVKNKFQHIYVLIPIFISTLFILCFLFI